MMRILFIKEIRDALVSHRFWVTLTLCLVLVPLGVKVSLMGYNTRLQNYREAVRISQEETRSVGEVLSKGAKALSPPSPLSFLSLGLELVLPNIAETRGGSIEPPAVMRFSNNQGRDNLYEFLYGPLDLIFIVGVVMSFLAIIMTYGAIAREKEQGTLRQVLSNSVPRAKVMLAKATANGVVLIVPFLLALVLSLAILETQGASLASVTGAWTFIMVAVLLAVLLIGTFFNLGLFISAMTKQAVSALVILVLAWAFLYGVYPRLASAAAQIIYPVRSEARLALEKAQIRRNVEKERDAEIDRFVRALPDIRKNIDKDAIMEGMKKEDEIRNRYQSRLEENWQTIESDVAERRKTGIVLATNIARLSPITCFVRPLSELGQTGWLKYEQFDTEVRRYEDVLNRDIFNKQEIHHYGIVGIDTSHRVDLNAPAPVFVYVQTSVEDVVRNVLPDIILLVLFNLVFFASAFIAFIRYDAR